MSVPSSDLSPNNQTMPKSNNKELDTLIAKVLEEINNIPYDVKSVPQEKLDLANKTRSSLFPWRGQFSPELIEMFLDIYSQEATVVLDPFVGSGTTLFEASAKGLTCYGAEINPSAIEMARSAHFTNIPIGERKEVIHTALKIAKECVSPFTWDLFSSPETERYSPQEFNNCFESIFRAMLQRSEGKPLVHNILVNGIIRFMNLKPPLFATDFLLVLEEHFRIMEKLPYSRKHCEVFHNDARCIPLSDKSVDLIITSPPYINVFNYHQNNRQAMELVGWDLLEIAKSEIGSNRKNRQNRFLTVVQYSLDMLDTLHEMRRVLNPKGRAIIVVGRESNVRSVSFNNGLLVAVLALGGAGYRLEARQERKFKNKFGDIIYEEILHLLHAPESPVLGDDFARSVAAWFLSEASMTANEEQIRGEVLNAKECASIIQKSPLFKASLSNKQMPDRAIMINFSQEEQRRTMKTYPTPHLEKLKATLVSDKLPPRDKPQVEKAIAHYYQWIADMEAVISSHINAIEKLRRVVDLLNQYRIRMDIDLIFDSADDWLYRQKGQIKLDNSIIEEFLPRLINSPLVPEISQMNVSVGPASAFSFLWFDSSLLKHEAAGGLKIRTKDQDFAISKPLYLKASHNANFENSVEESTQLAYIAAECKTNLDKTMFQEASATARDLKMAIPSARYFLLCEWLDMKPVSSATTAIDKVLLLRKAKRISANIRGSFSTYKGRQEAKASYIAFLQNNPYRVEVFELFIGYIRQLLSIEPLDEETVLDRGYF